MVLIFCNISVIFNVSDKVLNVFVYDLREFLMLVVVEVLNSSVG